MPPWTFSLGLFIQRNRRFSPTAAPHVSPTSNLAPPVPPTAHPPLSAPSLAPPPPSSPPLQSMSSILSRSSISCPV